VVIDAKVFDGPAEGLRVGEGECCAEPDTSAENWATTAMQGAVEEAGLDVLRQPCDLMG